ncbi:phosphoribosyltransferase [Acidithiobacillus sulfuriphilus]|uniref:Phosphoribosyl transferase n=2 Tax=Acidithiobacillus sulfuriphilus TaxID=1867749 RepID=A0A3M8R1H7_9PROT|nr:phosphoribosyltransferase family protein [Acidithiobacillus sulfuriphilus]MCL5980598.1 phosphoribosyl transferase [Gammaproteobacteria bacterium]RNF61044.1 phosphoribosyl transferase [Acidithiobacillus sulfuriphilus]
MSFANREEAALQLARRLAPYRGKKPLILAIPRGAVPMGRIIADALEGDLDVVLVRKLGAPNNPEFAVGAVDEGGKILVEPYARRMGISDAYLQEEAARQLAVMKRRRAQYTPVHHPFDPAGRLVIVVDDGVATGATLSAALRFLRERRPLRLVAAVGVAPPEVAAQLTTLADEVLCLETPDPFYAVGAFYADFGEVTDDDVIAILRESQGAPEKPGEKS